MNLQYIVLIYHGHTEQCAAHCYTAMSQQLPCLAVRRDAPRA
jgi:hypothetical protein